MAKEKSSSPGTTKATRVRWPFSRATLEQALTIAYTIKVHNGGNPWEPEEIRKAIGAGTGGNAFWRNRNGVGPWQVSDIGSNSAEVTP